MNTIGLIDEEEEYREETVELIDHICKEKYPDWTIVGIPPFKVKENYIQWIKDYEIKVLLVDENLDIGQIAEGVHVDYKGSSLVEYLREFYKDLPIFAITAVQNIDDKLRDSVDNFNLILVKKELSSFPETYVKNFIDHGTSFYTNNKIQLEKLSELSGKAANRTASPEELSEMKGLQLSLSIPFYSEDFNTREQHIKETEDDIERLKALREEINQILKNS